MKLTPEQIAAAAYQAGFRGNALTEIVAIALAESGGNARALNPKGEHSVGLTQINMKAHGNRFGSERDLYDPVTNMKAAYALSGGGKSFRPWSVHPSSPSPHAGASNRYLNVARRAVRVAAKTQVPDVAAGPGDTSAPQARFDNLPGSEGAAQRPLDVGMEQVAPEVEPEPTGPTNGLWTHMFQSMSNQIRSGSGDANPAALSDALRTLGVPLDDFEPLPGMEDPWAYVTGRPDTSGDQVRGTVRPI